MDLLIITPKTKGTINMEKVRLNNGKAVHLAEVKTDKNGKQFHTVSCGTARIQNARATVYRPAGKNEEVTCKKCLAAMEAEAAAKPAAEMSIKEYVEKFGRSFTMTKEEMTGRA